LKYASINTISVEIAYAYKYKICSQARQ
jgi:hypothetical protein